MGARFRSTDSGLPTPGFDGGLDGADDGNGPHDFDIPAGVNLGRRRSRAVLYQLSGHYKPEKVKTKLKLNSVSIFFSLNSHKSFVNITDSCMHQYFWPCLN